MKMDKMMCGSRELEFAIFCIENVASRLHVDAQNVYVALSEQTNILNDYIIPEYEVLHTQSKDYIHSFTPLSCITSIISSTI